MGKLLARYVGPGYSYGVGGYDYVNGGEYPRDCLSIDLQPGTLKTNTKYTIICRYKFLSDNEEGASAMIGLGPQHGLYLYKECIHSKKSEEGQIVNAISTTNTGDWGENDINAIESQSTTKIFAVSCDVLRRDHYVTETTPELTIYWCELWEGDIEFSLQDAIAISDKPNADDFQEIIDACSNKNYFSDANPINNLISWIGYTKSQ